MSSTDREAFALSQEYVGFWARFGATILDTILLSLVILPLLFLIYGSELSDVESTGVNVVDFSLNHIFPLVVSVLFWVYKSATPGKMVFKAQVVDAKTGKPPSVKQSIIRYISYYISLIVLGLGFLWVIWDKKKQAWHDKLAGTVVIAPRDKGAENVTFSSADTVVDNN
ncbi:RDD family protein [uncultured Shewanella sp.]|uniref:RDD family protein n=1 Tax=uncultured Shewanella sp. TaxID=173975 RepID=UPI002629859F|nr:RDD family protein [uncultured Shewanella sp.]